MEQRQTYLELLDVIKRILKDEEVSSNMEWMPVFLLAKQHHMLGFVYRAVANRTDIGKPTIEQIETAYFASVGDQSRQEHHAVALFAALRERGIGYLPMAGFVLRGLYPQPTWRNSADLDITVSEENREEVAEILASLSFTKQKTEDNCDFFTLDHVVICVHFVAESFWEKPTSEDGVEYRYSAEDFYIEILSLMKARLAKGECGIRPILDLYIYRHADIQMDEEKVATLLEENDLTVCERSLVQLSEIWFGDGEMTDDMMLLGSYIASAGTIQDKVEEDRHRKWHAVFPRFRDMKRRYPFLHGLPFLLPVMWVVRWFALLFTRGHDKRADAIKKSNQERSLEIKRRVREIVGIKE